MTKLSADQLIHSQLPRFIASEYDTFVKFLEAYYEFLGQYEDRSIESITDIDESLDEFYRQFKFELDNNFGSFPNVDETILLRNIRELYAAKGSKASYELLFRILFNKEVEITLPSEIVLKPSDNKWLQEISVVCKTINGDPFSIVGKEVNIIADGKILTVFVQKVKFLDIDTYEIFIDKGYYGNIEVSDKLVFGSYAGIVIPSISKLSIISPGFKFTAGQIFEVKNPVGRNGKIKINSVDTEGRITSVSVINFGFVYENDFIVSLYPSVPDTSLSFTNDNGNLTIVDGTNNIVDQGFISTNDYYSQDYVDQTYVGRIRSSFYNESTIIDTTNVASLLIKVGSVSKYPGYFESNKGFLSDIIKLQDSLFYQNFSYVIKIDEQFNKYKDMVKMYLHPAGTKMFGEYVISNTISAVADIKSLSNFINRKFTDVIHNIQDVITIIMFYNRIFSDSVSLSDYQAITIMLSKGAADTVTASDSYSAVKKYIRVIQETVDTIDSIRINDAKEPIYDYAIPDDTFSFATNYNRVFNDSIDIFDAADVYNLKSYQDSLFVDDSGVLTKNAYNDDGYFGDDYYVTDFLFIDEPQYYDEGTNELVNILDTARFVIGYGLAPTDSVTVTYRGQISLDGYVDSYYFDDPYVVNVTMFNSGDDGDAYSDAISNITDESDILTTLRKSDTDTLTEYVSILINGWANFYSDDDYAVGFRSVANEYSFIPDGFIENEDILDDVVN